MASASAAAATPAGHADPLTLGLGERRLSSPEHIKLSWCRPLCVQTPTWPSNNGGRDLMLTEQILAFLGAKKKKKQPIQFNYIPFLLSSGPETLQARPPPVEPSNANLVPRVSLETRGSHVPVGALQPARFSEHKADSTQVGGTSAAPSTHGTKRPSATPAAMRPDCVQNGGS